jgi:hypothetical protein
MRVFAHDLKESCVDEKETEFPVWRPLGVNFVPDLIENHSRCHDACDGNNEARRTQNSMGSGHQRS